MRLSQKAIDALLAVREAIAIDPASFDMEIWCGWGECGATLCIAGHLCVYAGAEPRPRPMPFSYRGFVYEPCEIVEKKFGISGEQAEELFYKEEWPVALQDMYNDGNRVLAAQLAIDWFIRKYSAPEREREQPESVETAEESVNNKIAV